MWLIFCGAYDNEGNGRGSESGIIKNGTEENLIFFNAFFLSVAVGMLSACRLFQMREEAKGIKKRDKIFKTLQLKDITFIHKLCMRG